VVPPSVFIPIAERTGLIIPIGARVLDEACQRLADWQRDYAGTEELAMSVNVSPRQLYSDHLVDIVAEALIAKIESAGRVMRGSDDVAGRSRISTAAAVGR
jgi:EAL domain-containing protein (putative c-di-GMP-specific phosphodiesterase class I)